MKAGRLSIVMCLVLLLASCGSKAKKDIIGKWEEIDGPEKETVEFSKDGTVKLSAEGVEMDGEYKFIDSDRISLEFKGPGGVKMVFPDNKVSIDKDKLTMTNADGDTTKYQRVK